MLNLLAVKFSIFIPSLFFEVIEVYFCCSILFSFKIKSIGGVWLSLSMDKAYYLVLVVLTYCFGL